MNFTRRHFLQTSAALAGAAVLPAQAQAGKLPFRYAYSPISWQTNIEEAIKVGSRLGFPGVEPFRACPGNRPSSTLTLERIDARNLGRLLALYEHKVFTQGVIWNVNSFDQWGVELGKQLARRILSRRKP